MNQPNWLAAVPLSLLLAVRPVHADWPVIDIGAIGQLVSQLRTMQDQLSTARDQLTEARSTIASLTGPRGMDQLLVGAPRNYLPANWSQVVDVLATTSTTYAALATDVQVLLKETSILSDSDLGRLTPAQQQIVDGARRDAAGLAAMTREALATSSGRFASLNSLISAIGVASDPKAIYDLQARIVAENTMLQNEATKLGTLYQGQAAQAALRAQRIREMGIADAGNLRSTAPMGL